LDPHEAERLARTEEQLVIFAREVRELVGEERARREEVEIALSALQGSYMEMVRTLAFVVEAKDMTTRSHLDRTYQYAIALCRRVAPELANDATIGYGFLLHDIGKIGIPESILRKPGPLNEEEWAIMKTHPLIGVQVVSPIKFLGDAVAIIRSHHERWDGKGYPEGLRGEEIHLGARIFSLVDTFDAITSERPYQGGLPVSYALEEVERCAGTQFDPEVARAFIAMCEEMKLADVDPRQISGTP
jgi:HD-GYP domain-containing protein (c-di-GMP phosphodiesterase class II)